MPSFSFPPEILALIAGQLPSSRDVSSLARTNKQINFYTTPLLYSKVSIHLKGARTRLRAIRHAKSLANNSANVQLIRELCVTGYWRTRDDVQRRSRRQERDITDAEREFSAVICSIIPLMKNLSTFRWRIIAYLPPIIGDSLLRNDRLQHFEVFVDPQLETLTNGHDINGFPATYYPTAIIPIGLHSLTSLHILQLGTFRDCACYGDIIQASPNLQSLWVDVSPTFDKMLGSISPQYSDVLCLLLRQQAKVYQSMPWFADKQKLKLTDLRLSGLRITMSGVHALQDCLDLNYLSTFVLNLCAHEELMPFLTRRTPNMTCFREDEESELLYVEEFLRYNAAVIAEESKVVSPMMRHKKPLEELWLSCAMTRDDGLGKLSGYLKVCGIHLRKLCLDMNWGEFAHPEEVMSGCSRLEELAVWIECEGDQWESMAKAIVNHPKLRDLCIFNTNPRGEPLSERMKNRLYSCVKSNRLGQQYLHHKFNEDGESIGEYQRSYRASREMPEANGVGDLQHVAIRHDVRGEVALTIWKILADYEAPAVVMANTILEEVDGTRLFHEVTEQHYFYLVA